MPKKDVSRNFDQNWANKSDEELVILTIENQDNFLYLIERYKKRLLAYIKRISGVEKEEAEDILQDVFIKVYQNLLDFDPDLKFSSWIYRITHNTVISNYRKIKARPVSVNSEIDNNILNKIAIDFNIEEEINRQFLNKSIYQVLNKLDIKYKEIIILKFFEEKTYQEISDIIKKPMGTVASLLNKAKRVFKEELSKHDLKL